MPTTTTTWFSILSLPLPGKSSARADRETIGAMMKQTRKIDWNALLSKVDRAISLAGAAALILAGLYFAPLFISILSR